MARPNRWLTWPPRILTIIFALFLSFFAFNGPYGTEGEGPGSSAFFLNLLPALVCLLVLVAAWRREWIGALAFVLLAAMYAWATRSRPDWVVALATPMLLLVLL